MVVDLICGQLQPQPAPLPETDAVARLKEADRLLERAAALLLDADDLIRRCLLATMGLNAPLGRTGLVGEMMAWREAVQLSLRRTDTGE